MLDRGLEILFNQIKDSVLQYFTANYSPDSLEYKEGREISTRFDRDIEALIISKIEKQFPDHRIISEERGITGKGSYCWHIDPVDNTVGLVAGERDISVSIALKKDEEYVRSLVINPRTGEVFEAYNGLSLKNGLVLKTCGGSLYDGVRAVSTCAYVRKDFIKRALNILGKIYENRIPVRISGGSALDLCYVAEGRSVAHVSLGAHTWDVEAGIHMVRGAGGVVDILARFPDRQALALVAAASPAVLDEVRRLLRVDLELNAVI